MLPIPNERTQNDPNIPSAPLSNLERPTDKTDCTAPSLSLLEKITAFCRSPVTHHTLAIAAIVALIIAGVIISPAISGYLLLGFLTVTMLAPILFDKQINLKLSCFTRA